MKRNRIYLWLLFLRWQWGAVIDSNLILQWYVAVLFVVSFCFYAAVLKAVFMLGQWLLG